MIPIWLYFFSAINQDQLTLTDDAINTLIDHYCRESGVRSLQKHIEKIFRKAAYKIVKGNEEGFVVSAENVKEFVGDDKSISGRIGFFSK